MNNYTDKVEYLKNQIEDLKERNGDLVTAMKKAKPFETYYEEVMESNDDFDDTFVVHAYSTMFEEYRENEKRIDTYMDDLDFFKSMEDDDLFIKEYNIFMDIRKKVIETSNKIHMETLANNNTIIVISEADMFNHIAVDDMWIDFIEGFGHKVIKNKRLLSSNVQLISLGGNYHFTHDDSGDIPEINIELKPEITETKVYDLKFNELFAEDNGI